MSAGAGMSMGRLIGVEVYLRLEDNTDFLEDEQDDGRIIVKITGVEAIGLWALNRQYAVKRDSDITMMAAQILIPFRSIKSIAMLDNTIASAAEESEVASLEEMMADEGGGREELEHAAANKITCSRASFRGAALERANLANIIMQETDLEGADLRNAILTNADLRDASLREIQGDGADFSEARLWGASLEGSSFTGASFKNANLLNANFKSANLSKANLEGANLVETTLTDCNLKGANLEGVKLLHARVGKLNATEVEYKSLGASLRKEGKDLHATGYFTEAKWCLEKAVDFFQMAKDQISASEAKNYLEDVEEEEKLSAAMSRDR